MNEDLGDKFKQIQNMLKTEDGQNQINSIISMFKNQTSSTQDASSSTESNSNNATSTPNPGFNFDIETMMKVQNIISKMNGSGNASVNLLNSLKPYLGETKKGKLDTYIQLMSITSILPLMKDMNFGKKGDS